jgi:hypothetical protein
MMILAARAVASIGQASSVCWPLPVACHTAAEGRSIAWRLPLYIAPRLAAITHIQLAAAMTTAQKPRQKQFSAPHRSSDRGTALTGRIVGNHLLVPLELAPGDITFVLILEQHIPFRLPQRSIDRVSSAPA